MMGELQTAKTSFMIHIKEEQISNTLFSEALLFFGCHIPPPPPPPDQLIA